MALCMRRSDPDGRMSKACIGKQNGPLFIAQVFLPDSALNIDLPAQTT